MFWELIASNFGGFQPTKHYEMQNTRQDDVAQLLYQHPWLQKPYLGPGSPGDPYQAARDRARRGYVPPMPIMSPQGNYPMLQYKENNKLSPTK